jgi:hypothetical protein
VLCQHVEKLPPSVVEVLVGCVEFFEGTKAHQNGLAIPICVLCRFELFLAIEAYEEGQKVAEGLYGGGGLTLGVGHLVRPPRFIFKHCWWKDNVLSSLLITTVDACHMLVMG